MAQLICIADLAVVQASRLPAVNGRATELAWIHHDATQPRDSRMVARQQTTTSPRSRAVAVERLQSDLFMARRAIVNLMRPEAKRILIGLSLCQSRDDLCDRAVAAAQGILALGDPIASEEMGDTPGNAPRAECLLCHDGSANLSGVQGFAVPEWLLRHPMGAHNSRRCDGFAAAYALGRDSLGEVE